MVGLKAYLDGLGKEKVLRGEANFAMSTFTRVAKVVTVHGNLLTQ